MANAVGATPPAVVVLDDSFAAGFGVIGVRRRHVLSLGVPLWTVLDEHERVALLAHEIAHDVDGDPSRTVVVGEAAATPNTTHDIPPPDAYSRGQHAANAYAEREATYRVFLGGTGAVVHAVRAAKLRLLYPANRRSEYVADDIAVRAASSPAVSGYLAKTLLQDYVDFALVRAARSGEGDLWEACRRTIAAIPTRERERLRRLAMLRDDRVDATHPPTALRLRFVESRPVTRAEVCSAPRKFQIVDQELTSPYATVAATIRDRLGA